MKIIYKIFLFWFLSATFINQDLHAQEIEWQNTIGGSSDDMLFSIQQTADGGYILGGYSTSGILGDKLENNMDSSLASSDIWIIKINSKGMMQWQKTYGGTGSESLYSLKMTLDGGYLLGGYSNSNISGNKTENSMGGYDFWLVKIDSAGGILWQNTIGGSSDDVLYAVQQTKKRCIVYTTLPLF